MFITRTGTFIFQCMQQLVPAVTELVVAELMYLQWMDPKEPIYIYINSTGTTRDDGETVSVASSSVFDELFIFLFISFLNNDPLLFFLLLLSCHLIYSEFCR